MMLGRKQKRGSIIGRMRYLGRQRGWDPDGETGQTQIGEGNSSFGP